MAGFGGGGGLVGFGCRFSGSGLPERCGRSLALPLLPAFHWPAMELFQAKDHYILQQENRALWCSRVDGSLQLRAGEFVGRRGPGPSHPAGRKGRGAGAAARTLYQEVNLASAGLCRLEQGEERSGWLRDSWEEGGHLLRG